MWQWDHGGDGGAGEDGGEDEEEDEEEVEEMDVDEAERGGGDPRTGLGASTADCAGRSSVVTVVANGACVPL